MSKAQPAHRLDVQAFARSAGSLSGSEPLVHFPRLQEACLPIRADALARWSVRGDLRADELDQGQFWLHLQAQAHVPQTCQRCLDTMQADLLVDRWFRFVADEATALQEDETAEEDLLVLSADFNLMELLEDELLLALPFAPRHEVCPVTPRLAAQDPGFREPAPPEHPFAALAALKGRESG